jgi:hypothetical protein
MTVESESGHAVRMPVEAYENWEKVQRERRGEPLNEAERQMARDIANMIYGSDD